MEFGILGPVELRRDGRVVALGGGKPRTVLAALLVHANEPVSAERLAMALWGEEAPATAVRTVQVYVSRLRKLLGDDAALSTTAAGYRLRVRPEELDAARFEQLCEDGWRALARKRSADAAEVLSEALGLWRGAAFADVRYAPFVQAEIARLDELRWAAMEGRLEAELALGRPAVVLAEIERLLAEAPLRERVLALRMRALYAAGRQADALATYQDARRRLSEELGLEPGRELRALEQAILTHDPALGRVTPSADEAAEPQRRRDANAPAAGLTPTVGRERDLEAVLAAVRGARLVTLVGPGGVGKTRLAVEAARALAPSLPGGVISAWLGSVADAADVPAALIVSAGVVSQRGESPERALVRRLQENELLMFIDNFEHVLTGAAIVSRLLEACPGLRALVTSREPLRLRGEQVFVVEPLAENAAMALFSRLARARRSDFDAGVHAQAVRTICRRLDGVPLALELAAGRVGLLEPDQLAERLAEALPLLADGPRDLPERQRTVRATLDWSVGLLTADERAAFFALGAFAGSGELDAVEAVTGASLAVLDAIVAKSLALADGGRIRMLEVVRQYAAERLAASAAADRVRERHCDLYLNLIERHTRQVRIQGRGAALERIEREQNNLRAALAWAIDRLDAPRALRLVAALVPVWSLLHLPEGTRWADAALALPGGPPLERARGLLARALLAPWGTAQSRADAEAALPILRSRGDRRGVCAALCLLSEHHSYHGDFERAREHAQAAIEHAKMLDDPFEIAYAQRTQALASTHPQDELTLVAEAADALTALGAHDDTTRMLSTMGYKAIEDQAYTTAKALIADAITAARRAGDPRREAHALGNLALATLLEGDADLAERHFRRQLAMYRQLHIDDPFEGVLGLAATSAIRGDAPRAARLAAAAERFAGPYRGAGEQRVYDRLHQHFLDPARAQAGPAWAAWQASISDGLTPGEAIALALGHDSAE
jgi:predicted ATPase/DNA-binding SARP family transcriptional activator